MGEEPRGHRSHVGLSSGFNHVQVRRIRLERARNVCSCGRYGLPIAILNDQRVRKKSTEFVYV